MTRPTRLVPSTSLKIVTVEWIDATAYQGWFDHPPTHPPGKIVRSVGYLAQRDKRGVTIAQSVDDEGRLGELLFVPTGCLKSVKL